MAEIKPLRLRSPALHCLVANEFMLPLFQLLFLPVTIFDEDYDHDDDDKEGEAELKL